MKSQRKQVESMLHQLYDMHEQLFGRKYTIGGQVSEESEFNKIIEEFRELIFQIRHTQQERQERQRKKNFHQSSQAVQLNYLIREDIQRAQAILTQAATRLQSDKKKQKKKNKEGKKDDVGSGRPIDGFELIKKKETIVENCFELLKDVKEIQQGGVYQPPQAYQTLSDIRKQLIGKQYQNLQQDSINLQQEEFYQKANKNDQIMDTHLDQIIQGNQRILTKMKTANSAMDQVHQKVIKATKKTDALNQRVRKDEKDLLELLKTYRRPNQLCLDITLVLMVLALIGVAINLIRSL